MYWNECIREISSQFIAEARKELITVSAYDELRDVILLVFVNNEDLTKVICIEEMKEKLGLSSLKSHKLFIQSSCTVSNRCLMKDSNGYQIT